MDCLKIKKVGVGLFLNFQVQMGYWGRRKRASAKFCRGKGVVLGRKPSFFILGFFLNNPFHCMKKDFLVSSLF